MKFQLKSLKSCDASSGSIFERETEKKKTCLNQWRFDLKFSGSRKFVHSSPFEDLILIVLIIACVCAFYHGRVSVHMSHNDPCAMQIMG